MKRLLILAVALLTAGCIEENPTEVGGILVPGGDILTFEVVLPAANFLTFDTSFTGYVEASDANFGLVARRFENVLDANSLFRFSLPPSTITVRSGTTTVVDSFPRFVSGSLVFRIDTVGSTPRPVSLQLFRTAEEWHESATWTHRVDTTGVRLPWTTAGGTRGALISSAIWETGDSVIFSVDSTTLAMWRDTTNRARGAILVAESEGSRIRVLGATVNVETRSSINADTVLNVPLVPTFRTFVFNPLPPTTFAGIRIGGIPGWRSFVRFRSDLRSLVLPCTGGPSGCQVSLDSVHINSAQLVFRPLQAPPGFVPEDSLFIEARTVAVAQQVPLERSPIGGRPTGSLTSLIAPSLFRTPAANDVVTLDVTAFLIHLLDESVEPEDRLAPLLALLQIPEAQTFGFAAFAAEPTLRLVLTTSLEGR